MVPVGTTPTFVLTTNDNTVDWTAAEHVYVTFRQGRENEITKQDESLTIEARSISVYLSQTDTLRFKPGVPLDIQVNWTLAGGQRAATRKVSIALSDNLIVEVLE